MTQIIPVAGAESPLFQAIQGILGGVDQGLKLKEAERLRQRQEEEDQQRRDALVRQSIEDQRRRQTEDFRNNLNITELMRSIAAQTPLAQAPLDQGAPAAPYNPPLAPALQPTPVGPLKPDVNAPSVFAPPDAGLPPIPIKSEEPLPTPPQPQRKLTMKLPDGREVALAPLQYKEEAEADKLRQAKLLNRAQESAWDVPDSPETYGELAGQKDVPVSQINAVVARLGRENVGKETRTAKALADKEKKDERDKKAADDNLAVAAEADNWYRGVSQPKTGEIQSKAAAHISANPGKYPGGAPRVLTQKQWEEVSDTRSTLDTLDDIQMAYSKVKDKVGPAAYRFAEFKQRLPGVASDPDFVEFQRLLTGEKNLSIKRITGANMSQGEADRLMKGMAEGTLKPKEFEAALGIWRRNAERSLATLQGRKLAPMNAKPMTLQELMHKWGYEKPAAQ